MGGVLNWYLITKKESDTLTTVRFKLVAALLITIAILLSGISIYLVIKNFSTKSSPNVAATKQASVSGSFNINGVIPEGGSITLLQRKAGSDSEAKVFAANLPISDKSHWSFNTAFVNASYEIQAQVVVNGVPLTTSNLLVVTAPADDEVLTLNLESDSTGNTVISGNIDVNGYIPTGATIVVEGRKLGAQTFTRVAGSLPGKSRQFLSYTTAINGTTYEVQGVLLDTNGKTIGTSNILTITAPALNEVLTINSSAILPPVPTSAPAPTNSQAAATVTPIPPQPSQTFISGNINLNGSTPPNSRIVILQTGLNSSNYQVAVNNVAPTDGTAWNWTGAQNATWYTLIAVLKQHNSDGTDTDIATSAPITVASPATGVVFTLNSGYSLSAPGGQITVTCQTYNGGPNQNNWNVVVNFQSVSGAQSYWYQVGNSNGGNSLVNTANQTNNSSTQTVTAVFNNNTTYYARYSYANVPVAQLGSAQYSPFSSTTPLQCSH